MKFKREVPPPSRFPIGQNRPHPSQATGLIGCRRDRVERGPRGPRWQVGRAPRAPGRQQLRLLPSQPATRWEPGPLRAVAMKSLKSRLWKQDAPGPTSPSSPTAVASTVSSS